MILHIFRKLYKYGAEIADLKGVNNGGQATSTKPLMVKLMTYSVAIEGNFCILVASGRKTLRSHQFTFSRGINTQ